MARPAKTAGVIKSEKKSHRTKAEIKAREEAEQAVKSGKPLYERKEVQENKIAHKEFLRITKLMSGIDKNEALYSSSLNVYCELYAEVVELQKDLQHVKELAAKLEEKFDDLEGMTFEQIINFSQQITRLNAQKSSIFKTIDRKRNMMLAIDKENIMTISSALRSIPKTPQEKENPLIKLLSENDEEDNAVQVNA